MTRKIYKHWLLLCIALASFITNLSGQENIYNNFNADSIAVGDRVQLNIILEDIDPGLVDSIPVSNFLDIKKYGGDADSLEITNSDIVVHSYGLWQDRNNDQYFTLSEINWEKVESDDGSYYVNTISLSFFDVGVHVFEGMEYRYMTDRLKTNPSFIPVIFKEYDLAVVDSTGLTPIKDIYREFLGIQDIVPFLLIILGIVLIGVIIYLIRRRIRQSNAEVEQEVEEIILPPHVVALNELKELRAKELWQKGAIKQYQSELSHIIREYLEKRYNILALENTTGEILQKLHAYKLEEQELNRLKRILQIADLVKFAKAKPGANIHESFMQEAVIFVNNTKQITESTEEE